MKGKRSGAKRDKLWSVTRVLFVTTQIAALLWVSTSYGIAAYSTVKLGQPFPIETLSADGETGAFAVKDGDDCKFTREALVTGPSFSISDITKTDETVEFFVNGLLGPNTINAEYRVF